MGSTCDPGTSPFFKGSQKEAQAYINKEAQLCRDSWGVGGSPYHLVIVGDFNATYSPEDRPGNRQYPKDKQWHKFCHDRARLSPVLRGVPADATSFVSDSDPSRQGQVDNCYAPKRTHQALAPRGRVDTRFEHSSDHDVCVFDFDLTAVGAVLPIQPPLPEEAQPRAAPVKAIKTPIKAAKLQAFTEQCGRQLLPAILRAHDAVRAALAAALPDAPPAGSAPPPAEPAADPVGDAIKQLSDLDTCLFDAAVAAGLPHTKPGGTPPPAPRPDTHRPALDAEMPKGLALQRVKLRRIIHACRSALRVFGRRKQADPATDEPMDDSASPLAAPPSAPWREHRSVRALLGIHARLRPGKPPAVRAQQAGAAPPAQPGPPLPAGGWRAAAPTAAEQACADPPAGWLSRVGWIRKLAKSAYLQCGRAFRNVQLRTQLRRMNKLLRNRAKTAHARILAAAGPAAPPPPSAAQ